MASNSHQPPRLAQKFFNWYCNAELKESIEGDLEERFYENIEKKGLFVARVKYCLDVLKFINKYTLRDAGKPKAGRMDMIRMNLLSSIRFLQKNRSYSLINICGLTIGITVALLIFNFAKTQYSFDDFFEERNQIYRVNNTYVDGEGNRFSLSNSSPAFAPEFPQVLPEYLKATRMRYASRTRLRADEISFYEDQGYYADSIFLEILNYPLLAGNSKTALDEPNSILITEDMALKYFGKSEPIGEMLMLNDTKPLRVTGILAPIPSNSHLSFEFLISFTSYDLPAGYISDLTSWTWGGFFTYVLVNETTGIEDLTLKTNKVIADRFPEWSNPLTITLQPLKDIYLGSAAFPDDLGSPVRSGSRNMVSSLIIIASMILLICCFNFMNLTTATALRRSREVGVRKVLGARRKSILTHMLTDTLMLTFISMLLAVPASWALQDVSHLFGIETQFSFNEFLSMTPWVLAGGLLLSLLSTLYPALVISNVKIIRAISGQLNSGQKASRTRSVLVGLQFCISIALLTSTMIIVSQARLLQNRQLGIDKEHTLVVQMLPEDMARYYQTLKGVMEQNPHIIGVSQSERIVGDTWPVGSITVPGQDLSEPKQIVSNQVGYDYINTMGIKMKEGRAFSPAFSTDSLNAIVLNESAVKLLQLEDPIGKEVDFRTLNGPRKIIGVVEDFNFTTLHEEIRPMVLIMPFIDLDFLTIKVSTGDLQTKIAAIENAWSQVTADLPMELRFMDVHLDNLYKNEEQLGRAVSALSVLAVVLSCLGLYGLVIFSIHNRQKEVSIRKVLGARLNSLLLLLSKEYLLLIGLGLCLAVPLSYYTLTQWLNTYAYRVPIAPAYFIIAVMFFALVCMIAIGRQVVTTAKRSPVDALRNE